MRPSIVEFPWALKGRVKGSSLTESSKGKRAGTEGSIASCSGFIDGQLFAACGCPEGADKATDTG